MTMQIKRTTGGSETWSRYGRCTAAEIKYLVLSPTSKRAAIQGVIAAAPTAYGENNELPLKEFRFDGYVGEGDIEITAVYAETESSDIPDGDDEEATMSFDCGSGTKHVTNAIKQTKVYPSGSTKDDAGGGIGWNGKMGSEAEFAGVDVPTADMHEVYTKYIRTSRLTTAYKRVLCELYGKVNSKAFKGWDPGEAMFCGASYSSPIDGRAKVLVTFNFRIIPNEKNAKVSGISVGSKKGWEYLWARSKTENDTATNTPKVVTQGIYKSEVVEYADFSRLGI